MRLDWRTPFLFAFRDPDWRQKLLTGGLWLLLLPPLGWPMALGYRKEALFALIEGDDRLPSWKGRTLCFLREGLKAMGVILAYMAVPMAVYWWCAVDRVTVLLEHPVEVAAFFAAVVLVTPAAVPTLPIVYAARFPWIDLSLAEGVVIAALFGGTVFLMPAIFLQVSLRQRFLAAFRLDRAVRLALAHPRAYVEAWTLSLIASAIAVMLGPLLTWGIFWSYLVIVHAFNQVLLRADTSDVRVRFARAVFFRRETPTP